MIQSTKLRLQSTISQAYISSRTNYKPPGILIIAAQIDYSGRGRKIVKNTTGVELFIYKNVWEIFGKVTTDGEVKGTYLQGVKCNWIQMEKETWARFLKTIWD